MSSPELVVIIDIAVRRGRATERLRACHALLGGHVGTLVIAAEGTSKGTVDVREWRGELARVCGVTVPGDASAPPADGPDLPWDLVLGVGAALAERRPDLQAELLARVDAPQRAQVTRLHAATVGRLRATGLLPTRRRVGLVSWLLFADGWRALTPYVGSPEGAGTPMLRLDRRLPEDLSRDVAGWVSQVRR